MTRKCLIALTVMALSFGSVAHAHPMWAWGVTTAVVYEWAKKECGPISVCMKVVRWADIYGCCRCLVLKQQATDNGQYWKSGDFVGCLWLKVCNNFVNLRIDAELIDSGSVRVRKWYVSLVELPGVYTTKHDKNVPDNHPNPKWNRVRDGLWGELPGDLGYTDGGQFWDDGAETTLLVPGVHLSDALGWLSLCARARGVDPQSAQFFPDDPMANVVEVATILLTFYPNDPPGDADRYLADIGSGGAYPTDDLNDPDIDWDTLMGGGGGIP